MRIGTIRIEFDPDALCVLRRIADALEKSGNQIEKELEHMADTLDDVLAEVTAEQTIDAGLLALINNLEANQNDPAKVSAILAGMKANIAPLAAALTANTPAAPPPAAGASTGA